MLDVLVVEQLCLEGFITSPTRQRGLHFRQRFALAGASGSLLNNPAISSCTTTTALIWFLRGFGGITVWSKTEVCPILHPEGMSAISRGLRVRDTPGVGCLELTCLTEFKVVGTFHVPFTEFLCESRYRGRHTECAYYFCRKRLELGFAS